MGMFIFKHIFFRSFLVFHGTFLLFPVCWTLNYIASPFFQNTPFVWFSDSPTEACGQKYKTKIDMSLFVQSGIPGKQTKEEEVANFYRDKLGYYPFISREGENVNGGIPQLGCLSKHLRKLKSDITYIIGPNRRGLAVIDWPEWKPLWDRTWGYRQLYVEQSIELVRIRDGVVDVTDATAKAKAEFENAGKEFMKETLKIGKLIRPKFFWGFLRFPDCYNSYYQQKLYNGSCVVEDTKRNDQLAWLWKESTAIYPSLYISTSLSSAGKTTLFIQNRVQEAIRISKVRSVSDPTPIFAYFLPVFSDVTDRYLSVTDLVATIGEAIALGTSGLVMWGSFKLHYSLEGCKKLQEFVQDFLNPYIINVTLASKMCSQVLCHNEGVCVRKQWNSSDYLHLNPKNFAIQFGRHGKYTVLGQPTRGDFQELSQKFNCACYANVNCTMRTDVDTIDTVHVCFPEDVCIDASLKAP